MPTIVDSSQCHLWTDALHARQLAREALNKWDRGTYVRMCVNTSWSALEVACQDALECPDIGYRFKENLDRAVAAASLPQIDWSTGVWQRVRLLQERRKSYVHRFANLQDMFPSVDVADEAIDTVRLASERIFALSGRAPPIWTALDSAHGWQARSSFGASTITACHAGASIEDPLTVKVYIVIGTDEKLTAVLPAGHNPDQEVARILCSVRVPINGIRVYEDSQLKQDLIVNMRGNA